ncbi:MAG: ZIP family metal transporter [Gammaproteobacteria bacterium]|nr:ZIP family metal transporter [Gammaproteobacteria bacterium]MCF6363041.1 ZIP family metal transporter [Gammaproteobacteria bacterium]
MSLLTWIIIFSLLGGVLSVLVAASFLLLPASVRSRLVPHLVSFAIGSLLGAAFLGLLPHALMSPGVEDFHDIFLAVLLGLLTFFVLEKLVLWRHCHSDHCEAHSLAGHGQDGQGKRAAGSMILIGDGLHNFVDGVLITAAFLTDIHLGIVTALAIAAHEIPQEVGDFVVLLHSGFSRTKALLFNVLSSLTTIVGALLAYWSLSDMQELLPYVLAVAASSFIYIAVADLIPGLHKRAEARATLEQVALIGAGVLLIYMTHSSLH